MEKTMNTDKLTETELDAVSGGADACQLQVACISFGSLIGPGASGGGGGGGTTTDPVGVWNQLLHQYGYWSTEMTMSKTNETSKLDHRADHRALTDTELDAVAGGYEPAAVEIGDLKVT
jgi:hypothetical protein